MAAQLTELGRRVLGSLPAWAEDEKAVVEAEGGPEFTVRSHTLEELTAELALNPFAQFGENGTMTADEVQVALDDLQRVGFVEFIDGAHTIAGVQHENAWRMTKLGFETITAAPDADTGPARAAVIETFHHDASASGQGA